MRGKTHDTDDNQIDGNDQVQQLRLNQDQNARDQSNDRRNQVGINMHGATPISGQLPPETNALHHPELRQVSTRWSDRANGLDASPRKNFGLG